MCGGFPPRECEIRRWRQMHTIALAHADPQTLKQLRRQAHKYKNASDMRPPCCSLIPLVFFVTKDTHTHNLSASLFCLSLPQSLTTTHAHILHVSIRGGGRSVFRAAFQVDRTLIHQTPALCHFVSAATFRVKEKH